MEVPFHRTALLGEPGQLGERGFRSLVTFVPAPVGACRCDGQQRQDDKPGDCDNQRPRPPPMRPEGPCALMVETHLAGWPPLPPRGTVIGVTSGDGTGG